MEEVKTRERRTSEELEGHWEGADNNSSNDLSIIKHFEIEMLFGLVEQ